MAKTNRKSRGSKSQIKRSKIRPPALSPAIAATPERKRPPLTEKRLHEIFSALSDVNMGLVAIHRLAQDSADPPSGSDEAGLYAVAIENIAKVGCRKLDVINSLLGDDFGFGNFRLEFTGATHV